MKWARLGTLVLLAALAAGRASAQEQGPWWTWPTIDGDWAGFRDRIAAHGLVFSGTTVSDLQGNVSGGSSKGVAEANAFVFALDMDMEKLIGLKGSLLHAEFVANTGQNLSTKSINNVLQVATAFSTNGYYLGQLYAKQTLFSDRITLEAGRLTSANDFASLPVFSDYVSFADNPIPSSLTGNTIYFTSLPSVEWGAVATVAPIERIALAIGIYNSNLPSGLPVASRHGIDFSFEDNDGPMEIAQVTYSLNRGQDDTGLPGTYYFGGFYSGADYQLLSGESERKGNYGLYFEAQQMVYRRGGPGSDMGLTPWVSISYTPEENINQLPVLGMAGLAYHGLFPRRSDDDTAFGFYYGKLSASPPVANDEKVMELDYTLWATPWMGVTPDVQYVLNPGGGSSSRNAAVLGVQVQVLF